MNSELAAIAADQWGAFSITQAREAGITGWSLKRAAAAGALRRACRGVYCVSGTRDSWRQRLMIACLAKEGLASHLSAARLWKLDVGPRLGEDQWGPVPQVLIPDRASTRIKGATAHRSKHLLPGDRTLRDGIPVTTPARTLLDLAEVLSDVDLAIAIEEAFRSGICSETVLEDRLAEAPPRSRAVNRIRSWLATRGGRGSDSPLEVRMWGLIIRKGLPQPAKQYWLDTSNGKKRLDLAYPPERVVIECDGRDKLQRNQKFVEDRARSRALAAGGWLVLPVTREALDSAEDAVAADILSALAHRRKARTAS